MTELHLCSIGKLLFGLISHLPHYSLVDPAHRFGSADLPQSRDRLRVRFSDPSTRRNPDLYIACCLSVLVFLVHLCRISDRSIHKSGSRHFHSYLRRSSGHVRSPTWDFRSLYSRWYCSSPSSIDLEVFANRRSYNHFFSYFVFTASHCIIRCFPSILLLLFYLFGLSEFCLYTGNHIFPRDCPDLWRSRTSSGAAAQALERLPRAIMSRVRASTL